MTAHSVKACPRKKGYAGRQAALQAIRFLKHRTGERGLQAYGCPVCGLWHVGHRRKFKG